MMMRATHLAVTAGGSSPGEYSEMNFIRRLRTGTFYAREVKANVLFVERKTGEERAQIRALRIYDLSIFFCIILSS
jgi:hypothetical protein